MQPIAKLIAATGLCSRRQAEKLIAAGKVQVDGEIVHLANIPVSAKQHITIDGKILPSVPKPQLWKLYKPKATITSRKDERGRRTIYEMLPEKLQQLHYIGRLDYNSEGLLLLTNTPAIKQYMENPNMAIKRKYKVRVFNEPSSKIIAALRKGVTIDGIKYRPMQIELDDNKTTGRNCWLNITLTEGKNREIRKILEYFGHPVSRLIRTEYGDFSLNGMQKGELKLADAALLQLYIDRANVE